MGVNKGTIVNWERNATTPALPHVLEIIRFLGYVPFPPGQSLPEKLKAHRRVHGLSQKELAQRLAVDESTVARWETGRSRPAERALLRLHELLGIVS